MFECMVLLVCSRCLIPGTSVMKVTASDDDDPTYGSSARVIYSVLDGEKFFSVDRHTGKNHEDQVQFFPFKCQSFAVISKRTYFIVSISCTYWTVQHFKLSSGVIVHFLILICRFTPSEPPWAIQWKVSNSPRRGVYSLKPILRSPFSEAHSQPQSSLALPFESGLRGNAAKFKWFLFGLRHFCEVSLSTWMINDPDGVDLSERASLSHALFLRSCSKGRSESPEGQNEKATKHLHICLINTALTAKRASVRFLQTGIVCHSVWTVSQSFLYQKELKGLPI